jgi:cytochrome c biogenesis protein CcmG, thiol:disulfide interchange protein DsbE
MTLTEQSGQRSGGRAAPNGERLWKWLAAVAAMFLIGFITYVVTKPHNQRPATFPTSPPASLAVGSQAPPLSLPRLGGGPSVSLSSTRGTPTIVNFFASWCRNCQAELSAFAALSAKTTGRVAIIGVDSNDSNSASAQTLLAGAKATYPVGVDSDAKVATSYLLNALPVTYFLDADGRVVHAAFGGQTLASLNRWAAVLIGKPVHP